MATLTLTSPIHPATKPRVVLWLAAVGVLATLLALLTKVVMNDHTPAQDIAVMDWVVGWDLPGLHGLFTAVSFLTSGGAGLVYGPAGIVLLFLLGKSRAALAFAVVGAIVGIVAVLGDYTLGEVVGRTRPLADKPIPSYPSGHVFGATVAFGFLGFLAVHYKLKRGLLIPFLAFLATLVLSVGPSRVYLQAHWPSDVAAGYLLAALWLLVLIPLFLYFKRVTSGSSVEQEKDLSASSIPGGRVERSIASVVMLDPLQGTATKVYRPPAVVRLIYWLAFQAKFPYESNPVALQAAVYRRKIASLLTIHRFGKDLVAPVLAVNHVQGQYSLVTEFVPGDKVANDQPAKSFLKQVSDIFAEAGLSVWQVNPRNPHAHTNLIRTPDGDFKVIDLESAIATPFPARGQWRSALRSGNIPVFDDLDFPRLREYLAANGPVLEASLGAAGLAEFKDAVERGEQAIHSWKDSEPHVWGRIARRVYRLLNWKPFFQRQARALDGADRAAESFLLRGIDAGRQRTG